MPLGEEHTEGASRPSVRRVSSVAFILLGTLGVVIAFALAWTTTRLERSVETVIRDTRSQSLVSQVELSLLAYDRLSNAYLRTRDPDTDVSRDELASEVMALVAAAELDAANAEERELIRRARRDLIGYLELRESAEARGSSLPQIRTEVGPKLDAAVQSLESLRALNRIQVRQASETARRLSKIADLVGMSAGVLFLVGLLVVVWGVRRYLLRPLLSLHRVMSGFQSGEFQARASDGRLREIEQLVDGFNEMAESLAKQRQDQLTFLAGVAHDLRNPLSALKLGLHALEQEQSDIRRARTRSRLERQIDRLSRMVDDLLDATRIEAGHLELRKETFDVREVVEDLLRLYAPTSPEHSISADLPARPMLVDGDALRIEQVLSNLISNAIKYSPHGGPVQIAVAERPDEVSVSVSDQGLGISALDLQNVFLPFRRRRADVAPGAGLGLSVVRRIVTAHGGRIDVKSEAGVGSTFYVHLPRAHPTEELDVEITRPQ